MIRRNPAISFGGCVFVWLVSARDPCQKFNAVRHQHTAGSLISDRYLIPWSQIVEGARTEVRQCQTASGAEVELFPQEKPSQKQCAFLQVD
jgi:hypothetical protein